MALLPQRGDSGFTLAGFLILAALGTFMWKGAPLESVRPSSEKGGWYERDFAQQVPARLWQDPFKAVHSHEQALKDGTAASTYVQFPQQVIKELADRIDPTELTVLMVLVSPGSYTELEERRRRRRFAVLSGLGEENFVPRNPEALNVFYRSKTGVPNPACTCPDNAISIETLSRNCYAVPYEWYDYEDPSGKTIDQRHVLVLWLNENQFATSPLNSITRLLDSLLPRTVSTDTTLRATMLGPARSDALRNLVTLDESEAYHSLACKSPLTEFNIYSPVATVADADLTGKRQEVRNLGLAISPLNALQGKINEHKQSECPDTETPALHFLRTIQSDDKVIETLAHELTQNRSISNKKDHVVLISEWDTYFGRSLPDTFIRYFCENDSNCRDNNMLRLTYQRGMDGVVIGEKKAAAPSSRSNKSKKNGMLPSIEITAMRRPVGTGQFDYLRRLAERIKERDYELRLSTGHGVKAVVLLGSDVYDKLLILRALRPELPGALFATTDLDAQLLHPAEFNWARSLIIASTYDLGLSLPVHINTMPFRDSYQTSMYLATRLGFNNNLMGEVGLKQKSLYDKIPPQLFEVGRQDLVQLSDDAYADNTWNRITTKSFAAEIALGLVTIALIGIFAFHQLHPRAGRTVLVLGSLLLLFIILSFMISLKTSNGEPLALLAGASTWPTEYIRIFSVVLSLVFIWSVINRLHTSWHNLGVRYFWKGTEASSNGKTLAELFQGFISIDFNSILKHPVQTVRDNLSQILPVIMVLIMILVMRVVLPIPLPLGEKIQLLILVWGLLIFFWWLTIFGGIWSSVEVLSINKLKEKCVSKMDATEMWRTYGKHGAGDQRFMRAIAYILLYFFFASILFAILGPPASPCRGDFACNIDKAILGFSVLTMLVLLFLVVDAARLCICWVSSLREPNLDWDNTRKPEFVQRLKLSDSHTIAWMKVHLIGERTAEVTRLIYYPVMIILLMLLARSTYFDNWDFPQALAIVVGLNFVIALGSIVRLNFVARSVREDILRELQEEKLAADKPESESYEPNPSERKELISQLEELQMGAYLRVWDQPAVRATLLLLGGVALTFAEYIAVIAP